MPDLTTIAYLLKRLFRNKRGVLENLAAFNPLEAAGLMAVLIAVIAVMWQLLKLL